MTNKSPYEQIEKLVEAGKKATQGIFEHEQFEDKRGISSMIFSMKIERPIARVMAHGFKDKIIGEREDNAEFIVLAANSRQAIEDMLNEHKRIEKIKSQVDVEALRKSIKDHYASTATEDDGFYYQHDRIMSEAAQTLLTILEGE